MAFALLTAFFCAVLALKAYWLFAPMFGRDVTARRETSVSFHGGELPRESICDVLQAIGCTITHNTQQRIVGHLSMTGWSWGEDIVVEKASQCLRVTSRCSSKRQAIDWGKNRRNLIRFSEEWRKKNA